MIGKTFNLTRSYRCADEELCSVLNFIRVGNVNKAVRKMLISRNVRRIGQPTLPTVKLVGLKRDAEAHNAVELNKLAGQPMVFSCLLYTSDAADE